MKIVNSEIKIPITTSLTSAYIEETLTSSHINFIRWAIVQIDEQNYILNVSHKSL